MRAVHKIWVPLTIASLVSVSACTPVAEQDAPATPSIDISGSSTSGGGLDAPTTVRQTILGSATAEPQQPSPQTPASAAQDTSCTISATLDPGDNPQDISGGSIDKILKRGRVKVGTDQGSNLFSFRDPVSGELQGFEIDIAREIAQDLFGDPNRIQFKTLSSTERLQGLEDGTVDFVIRSLPISCENQKKVSFSAPYFQVNQRLLVLKNSTIESLEDLSHKRVCSAKNSSTFDTIKQFVPQFTGIEVDTWADCLVAIQQNAVDAISGDDAILAGLARQDPYVEIVGDSIASSPYGIGVAIPTGGRDTTGVLRRINGTLERIIADGTWSKLHSRWLSDLGTNPVVPQATYEPGDAP